MFPFDTDFCFVWIKRYDDVKTRNHIFYAPFTGSEARCPPINLLSQDEWYREIFFRNLYRAYVCIQGFRDTVSFMG